MARDTQHVHPLVAEQGTAAGPCGSSTRPTNLQRVPAVASQVYEEDVIEDVYDVATRDDTQLQRAPLQRYVVRYSNGTICYPFDIKYVY